MERVWDGGPAPHELSIQVRPAGSDPLEVAIWGAPTLPNVGDRLISEMTRRELARRLDNASFTLFSPWKSGRAGRLWIDGGGRWSGTGRFDIVVIAGGAVWSGPPFRHPAMQVFCLGPKPGQFDPSVFVAWNAVDVEDALSSAAQGGLFDWDWTGHTAELGDRLDYCTLRSAAAALRFQVTGRTPAGIVPDPAFSLAPLQNVTRQRPRCRLRIGIAAADPLPTPQFLKLITPRELDRCCPFDARTCLRQDDERLDNWLLGDPWYRFEYIDQVASGASALATRHDVEILGITNMYGDDRTASMFHTLVAGSSVRIEPSGTENDLVNSFQRFDCLLVARFHHAILALRAGIPFVAIDASSTAGAKASKLYGLMDSLGLTRFHWHARKDQASLALVDCVNQAVDDPVDASVYRIAHRKSQAAFDALAERIEGARSRQHG